MDVPAVTGQRQMASPSLMGGEQQNSFAWQTVEGEKLVNLQLVLQ